MKAALKRFLFGAIVAMLTLQGCGPQPQKDSDQSVPIVGESGKDGRDGVDGTNGINGINGERGSAGPQGLQGAIGPTGPQGPPGPQGLQGAIGPTGPQGQSGRDGRDANDTEYPFELPRVGTVMTHDGRTYLFTGTEWRSSGASIDDGFGDVFVVALRINDDGTLNGKWALTEYAIPNLLFLTLNFEDNYVDEEALLEHLKNNLNKYANRIIYYYGFPEQRVR